VAPSGVLPHPKYQVSHLEVSGPNPSGVVARAEHSVFLKFRFGFSVLKNFGFLDIRNQSVF
jgi:hypothetical protein